MQASIAQPAGLRISITWPASSCKRFSRSPGAAHKAAAWRLLAESDELGTEDVLAVARGFLAEQQRDSARALVQGRDIVAKALRARALRG